MMNARCVLYRNKTDTPMFHSEVSAQIRCKFVKVLQIGSGTGCSSRS